MVIDHEQREINAYYVGVLQDEQGRLAQDADEEPYRWPLVVGDDIAIHLDTKTTGHLWWKKTVTVFTIEAPDEEYRNEPKRAIPPDGRMTFRVVSRKSTMIQELGPPGLLENLKRQATEPDGTWQRPKNITLGQPTGGFAGDPDSPKEPEI